MSLSSKAKIWSDMVRATAIAKTKGTFDSVADNANSIIISKPDAKSILGFMIGYCTTLVTDAENQPDLLIEVNSKALGISNEVIVAANGGSDANATNDVAPMRTTFFPFKLRPGFESKLFNAAITFKATPSVTNTGGQDVVICVIYSNGEPSSTLWMEFLAQMHGRVVGGDAKADAAKAHASSGTAVTLTSLTIPAGTKTLRGVLSKVNPNGITASDPVSGFFEFIAPGIPDFSPQIWPNSTFWNPSLGTVVAENSQGQGRYYPTRFPLTGSEVTVQVQSTQLGAHGTAPDTTQAVIYE